uniref:Coenzyme Q-binding protein COQ10 START domain-containing protein n=1 Tax=Tetradesmus obliquus TaxID=3088 RepID=A0A383VA10_TETOB|eukprot:jgi/Sobl393_1/17908/SZX61444.1
MAMPAAHSSSAQQHQAASLDQDSAVAEGPSVDSWSEKDQRIVVSQPASGFLYDLILRAKIDAPPDDVYTVLRDPNSHEIFRGIKDTLHRTTLEDDGKGTRKLRIGHRAVTKFLWLSVTFDTELFVWEDDNARTIRFTNARNDGFMKKFDGTWNVQPFTQSTLDSIYRPGQQQQQQQHGWLAPGSALSALQQRLHNGSSQDCATLVTLEQALAPKARPPGPLMHLVRGLCARVLQNMMADLRLEVQRRRQLEAAEDEAAAAAAKSGKGKGGKTAVSSLPVASITASSMRSSSSSRDSAWEWSSAASSMKTSSSSSSSTSGFLSLPDLLAAAVPLEVTIRL